MSHPLTDQLPDYLDANALRQACGEIEAELRAEVERLQTLAAQARYEGAEACARAFERLGDRSAAYFVRDRIDAWKLATK